MLGIISALYQSFGVDRDLLTFHTGVNGICYSLSILTMTVLANQVLDTDSTELIFPDIFHEKFILFSWFYRIKISSADFFRENQILSRSTGHCFDRDNLAELLQSNQCSKSKQFQ